jgi:hypothetical protein
LLINYSLKIFMTMADDNKTREVKPISVGDKPIQTNSMEIPPQRPEPTVRPTSDTAKPDTE